MYKAIFVLSVLIILGGYLYFSNPDAVVISEKGKVEGVINKARAMVQGDRFWKLQLKRATELYNKSIEPHPSSTAEMEELYRKLREDEMALDDKMKDLYTPEEKLAVLYRIKADSIERAGKWRLVNEADNSSRLKDAEKYNVIIPIIEAKLHAANPGTTVKKAD
jgi:hypothetical protein